MGKIIASIRLVLKNKLHTRRFSVKACSLILVVTIVIGWSSFVPHPVIASNDIVQQENGYGFAIDNFYGSLWKAQTFVPTSNHNVSSVSLRLKKSGAPTGNIVVSIRNVDPNGMPTGNDLAVASIQCSDIKTDLMNWFNFSFENGYLLQAGIKYAIIISAPQADSSNKIWYLVNVAGNYAPGWVLQSYSSGGSWADVASRKWDAVFEEWGDGNPPSIVPVENPLLVGYISGWSMSRMNISNVNIQQLTHLIYSYVSVVSASDPSIKNGWGWDYVTQAIQIGHAKGIKVLISLECSNSDLGTLVDSDSARSQLVNNLKNLLVNYGADGIDIDWESNQTQAQSDKLIIDLYTALHPLNKLITFAADWHKLGLSIDASNRVDFINVMTYDMNIPNPLPYHSLFEDSVASLKFWADAGYSKSKLLMGIPFYAKDNNGIVATYANVVDYLNPGPSIDMTLTNSIPAWDNTTNIVDGGVLWWGGTDLDKRKVDWVKANGFGGVMCFDVGQDKLNDERSLLQAIHDELGNGGDSLSYIVIAPNDTSMNPGATFLYTAQGYSNSGNSIADLTYQWSVKDPNAGNIDSTGLFTAGSTAGRYENVIGVTSSGITAFASISVNAISNPWDVNHDGSVSVLDLILVGQHMNESGSPGWIPEDINLDGTINVLDTILVGQHTTP